MTINTMEESEISNIPQFDKKKKKENRLIFELFSASIIIFLLGSLK